jgi:magnesium transporter
MQTADTDNIEEALIKLLKEGKEEEVIELLDEMPTVEVADFLGSLPEEEAIALLKKIPAEKQGFVFTSFEIDKQLDLVEQFTARDLARLFAFMQSDDRVDLFQAMETEEQSKLLPFLEKKVRENVIQLSSYPEDTAGGSMSSDFASITTNMTVKEAIDQVRRDAPKKETIYYIYVVDEDRYLKGFVSLKDLILADPDETIENIYHEEIVSVNTMDDQETVAEIISKYDLIAVPVVNRHEQLVGIVTHDDAIDIIREEETEDVQKMSGMQALEEPYITVTLLDMIKKRAGWLIVLFLGESLTATAMGFYEHQLAQLVVLALFVPLIISSGGNSGSQASTLVIRSLALNEISLGDWWKIVRKEFMVGLLLGIILGAVGIVRISVAAQFSDVYGEQWFLISLAVGLSLLFVVLWGTLIGSFFPLLLKRLGFDPAVSSAPFIATLVDVTGLIIYFSISIFLLRDFIN